MFSKRESIPAKIRLFHGACMGDVDEVDSALQNGAEVNCQLDQREKQVYAQAYGVNYNPQQNARLDYSMNDGYYVFDHNITPLQLCLFSHIQEQRFDTHEMKEAAKNGYYQVANLLLDAGAFATGTTGHGLTAIYLLLMKGFTNEQCMHLLGRLLEQGAPVTEVVIGEEHYQPVNLACWALWNGYREVFAILLNDCVPSALCCADGLRGFVLEGAGVERDTLNLDRLMERFDFLADYDKERHLLQHVLRRALNREFISSIVMMYKEKVSDIELASAVRRMISHQSIDLLRNAAAQGIEPNSVWSHLTDDGCILRNTGPITREFLRNPNRYARDDGAFDLLVEQHSGAHQLLLK